ncbi:unnamed protein product [Lepeophtheirus salmonis]|uniref:(salmon louse) hypothetical protein n=1 Tax=Lepeophtheirus salmonis TaxID=72036 RepID=A0A7R8HDK1_LEPSM|nr:unnamed protein product [Lepeophtheirus salmonis]CAF3027663.1 unnamed protein product [Lepeophtheirus salmonis]
MDGWSYYYIRIALAILFYICLVELIPFFVCSLIKYLFRAKTFYAHPVRSYHRKDIEGVIDEENRALELFLTHLEINILHELYFHDIFFIEFMGIYKWLKKLHGISGGSGGRLPPDVILYVKQIQIDFHDDPFEVRLKKNYELMEDEHYESEKRKKVLESKIDNFRRMNLMLPVNKIDEPFEDAKVFRNMVSTKIYHDIAMDMETFAAAHGPCARGAWTESNRDMCFCLYESWKRAHVLRQQISLDYLKRIKVPHTKESNEDSDEEDCASSSAIINVAKKSKNEGELSLSNIATWKTGADTVEKLLYDTSECTNHTPIVYSEDQSSDTKKKDMEAMLACSQNDTYHRRWNIKFINSQMLLKGIETEGHVILSASKAEIVQNFHIPVWRDRTLLSKKSWSGCLESMQCFATVSPNEDGSKLKEDQISWLTQNIIEEREAPVTMVSELVGSGQSVGGVISKIVGSKDEQLQRIISRCKCEFFYVDYDDCEGLLKKIPRPSDFQQSNDNVVNSFSLIHHDLNICTNSLQYSVVLDVLNNLMLYTEPVAKSRSENYLRMKYRLLLYNLEDQWKPITQLQNEVGRKAEIFFLSRTMEIN